GGFLIVAGAVVVIVETTAANASHPTAKENVVFEKDTFYHHIRVVDTGDVRELHFDNTGQSAIYKSKPLVSAYEYPEYLHLGRVLVPDPADVLVIGLGGGIVPRQLLVELPHVRIDCAEIDPEVIDVAHRFFGFPRSDPRLRVAAEDGR